MLPSVGRATNCRQKRRQGAPVFLPIGDEPNPKTTPWVTYGILTANLYIWFAVCSPALSTPVDPLNPATLSYLATMRQATGIPTQKLLLNTSAYDIMTYVYGFRPSSPSFVALFTSLFLHGSLMHVLGNMLFLWIFGDNIEARLGGKKYFGLYVASGVLATVFYAAFTPGSPLPLIGASGAISGILGAYFIWYGHHRVRVLMVLIIFIQIIYVPARWVLGFYLLVENLLPFVLQTSPTSTTAYGAHIGGFLSGGLFALSYGHKEATGSWGSWSQWLEGLREALRSEPPAATADAAAHSSRPVPQTAQEVHNAILEGASAVAFSGYSALGPEGRQALGTAATFTLADSLTKDGTYGLAAQVLKRYLGDAESHSKADVGRGHLRLGLLQAKGLGQQAAAREHLFAVLDLLPGSDEARTAREALAGMD